LPCWAKMKPNRGSQSRHFHHYQSASRGRPAMVGQRGSQEPVRVLVIEDDPATRRALAEALLGAQGREVVAYQAADATDAMDFSGETITAAAVSIDGGDAAELIAL